MTSPQKKSRDNKIKLFKDGITHMVDILTMKKDNLDSIDNRTVKKIVAQLKSWSST